MTSLAEALRQGRTELCAHESAGLDAEVLLAHLLNKPRSYLHAWPEQQLSAEQLKAYAALIRRRRSGEPVAYLTGQREFWSLLLEVTPDTLIPRPDTEILVEQALQHLPAGKPLKIADLGTGSGAIALALAGERPLWEVCAVDRKPAAINVAKRNASRLGIRLAGFVVGHWTRAFATGSLDAIVSNPPYVEEKDPHLLNGDVRYEPRSALAAGVDGLDDIRQLAQDADRVLVNGGYLLLEHAPRQTESIHNLLNKHNFIDISTSCDLAGHERVTRARTGR